MTKQEQINLLQDWVEKGHITHLSELDRECKSRGLDAFDDVLSGIGWNCCDRCGLLGDSELDLYWPEYMELDEEESKELEKSFEREGEEYCSVCSECFLGLVNRGRKE